ncbi:MAG: carboxypeptidase-like regulatory domain-containing protein [Candidatus Andersenbacteria bacterium]
MRLASFLAPALLSIAVISAGIFASSVRAAPFTESSLRFERLAINSANVRVLIIAKPASIATEAQVTLTLASGFTVNGTPGNVTTSTDDLPVTHQGEALVAWPGVGSSATGVSGQTATFASDDLDAGTLYGFYITSGISTPASVGTGEFSHILATKTAGSATIDQTQITTPVESSDQVTITGVIPGTSITADRDFGIRVTTTTTDEKVPPDTVRTYTVTYENNAESDFDIRLEAEWTLGQTENGEHHSFEVVSYVPGSAGKAYDNVTPVIDLDRRIISWTIPAFSKQAGTQTVEFQLRTANSSLSTLPLHYQIKARIVSGEATKEAEALGQTYTPAAKPVAVSPTPRPLSPTPIPSGTPTPPAATPIPPDIKTPLQIVNVSIIEITDTSFALRVVTNRPARLRAAWGPTTSLGQEPLVSPALQQEHILMFSNLQPGTTYYVELSAEDDDGERVTLPELFTVTTALHELPSIVDESRVSALAYGIALFQGISPSDRKILLPTGTPLSITIPFTENVNADVAIRIHDPRVQGLRVPAALPFQEFSSLTPATDQLYSGYVMTPRQTGTYTITVRVRTPDGILYQLPIAVLNMTDPMQVVDDSGNPIESANVALLQWHERDRVFVPTNHLNFGTALPYTTDADGRVPTVLAKGTYRIQVRAAGYTNEQLDVTFDPLISTAYPTIRLTADTSFVGYLQYYGSTIGDTVAFGRWSVAELAQSRRFIQLLTLIAVIIALVLLSLLIKFYTRTPRRILPRSQHTLARSAGHILLITLWSFTLLLALQTTPATLGLVTLITTTATLLLWTWLTVITRPRYPRVYL